MKLTLVNFQSEEEIDLDAKDPVIIGRGSLFGCTDNKVSRNHGQIQLALDGNVHLTALHTNPCFFMKNGLPPVHQLAKNEEKILNNGDYFGLLPDSYWYKIVVKNNDSESGFEVNGNSSNDLGEDCQTFKDSRTEKNINQIISEEVESDVKSDQLPEPDKSKSTAADDEPAQSTEKDCGLSNEGNPTNKSEQLDSSESWLEERLKALEKTRKLPLSMYEIDDFPGQFEQINFQENSHCSSENNETLPAETEVTIEEDLTADTTSADASVCNIFNATSEKNASQEETKVTQDIEESDNVAHDSVASTSEIETCDNNEEVKNMDVQSTTLQKRPMCQYEEKCYRKNDQHRREFCHPGDPDFIPYSQRPKCQYGASCYRQNKTHLVEYQHPKSKKQKGKPPADSPKRKRQKKKEETYDSFEEDDYDFEDPFANSGSSDEYIPSDLDSDDGVDDMNS